MIKRTLTNIAEVSAHEILHSIISEQKFDLLRYKKAENRILNMDILKFFYI